MEKPTQVTIPSGVRTRISNALSVFQDSGETVSVFVYCNKVILGDVRSPGQWTMYPEVE